MREAIFSNIKDSVTFPDDGKAAQDPIHQALVETFGKTAKREMAAAQKAPAPRPVSAA